MIVAADEGGADAVGNHDLGGASDRAQVQVEVLVALDGQIIKDVDAHTLAGLSGGKGNAAGGGGVVGP